MQFPAWFRPIFTLLTTPYYLILPIYGIFAIGELRGDERDFLLQGVMARAEALHSADFRAVGKKLVSSEDEMAPPSGDIIIEGAFEPGKIRFDYQEPSLVIVQGDLIEDLKRGEQPPARKEIERLSKQRQNPSAEPSDVIKATIETYYIKNGTKIAYWFNGSPSMFTVASNSDVPRTIRRFDISALGLYGILEFNKGLELGELVKGYQKAKLYKIITLSDSVKRIEFLYDNPSTSLAWAIDINPEQGFTCVGSQLTETSKRDGKVTIPQKSTVSWTLNSGVWVPTEFAMESIVGKTTSILQFTFEYASVNTDVDDKRFLLESIPLPEFGAIIDNSGAKPVVARAPYISKQNANLPTARSRILAIVAVCGAIASFGLLLRYGLRLFRRD